MTLTERILDHLKRLPPSAQEEILDFAEFLETRQSRRKTGDDDRDWRGLALSPALRGMEDEPELYTPSDLRQRFS